MFRSRVKLDKKLLERVEKAARAAGYSSPEDFITEAVERQLAEVEGAVDEEAIRKRLRGLGYLP